MNIAANLLNNNEPYIFVSCARDDSPRVERELAILSDHGFSLRCPGEADPWQSVDSETMKMIRGCALFLVFVTPSSANSDYCRMERSYALEQERTILCVHLQESDFADGSGILRAGGRELRKYAMSPADFEETLIAAIEEALLEQINHQAPARELAEIDRSWSMMIVGWFVVIGVIAFGLMVWLES